MYVVTTILRYTIALGLIFYLISPVMAEEISVVERRDGGGLVLSIDGVEYVALPTVKLKALKNDLDEARISQKAIEERLKETQKLLEVYESSRTLTKKAVEADKTLIAALKSVKDAYKSISHDYSDLSLKFSNLSNEYRTLLSDFSKLAVDYKTLGEQYRGLVTGKVGLRVDLGIGMRSDSEVDEVKPAFLIGAGYRWIRLWGTFDENSTGVLAGVSIPIF